MKKNAQWTQNLRVRDLLWFLFSFCVIVYQLEMIWTCGLTSNKGTKSLKFCRREIPIIVFGCMCTTIKNSQTYMNRSDPNQLIVIALRWVLHWIWGPTHRHAIKSGKWSEGFLGDPLAYSNHHSVWKTLFWCIIFGLVWFDFCFMALQHILGHFGHRRAVSYPNHTVPVQAS